MRDERQDPLAESEKLWALLTNDFKTADGHYLLRVLDRLMLALRGAFQATLDGDTAHDAAVDSVQQVQRAVARGVIKADANLSAYLLASARNAALSRLRRQGDTVPYAETTEFNGLEQSDDNVARALDHLATVDAFAHVLRCARDKQDTTVFRLVTYLLDEVDKTGDVPSDRQAAAALNISHTGVAKARRRIQTMLQEFAGAG